MKADLKAIVAQRAALYATAAERSAVDAAFRERLIAKPRPTLDALAKELGLEARVPEGVKVTVLDFSPDQLYLVLPPPAETPLSESELERVAGGAELARSTPLDSDAHGCPACPHPTIGPTFRSRT